MRSADAARAGEDKRRPGAALPAPSDRAALGELAWRALPEIGPDPARLADAHIVAATRADPAHLVIDRLATRLIRRLRALGHQRIGITSPTPGSGKTMLSANLAYSLARRDGVRIALVDLDFARPGLSRLFGAEAASAEGWLARAALMRVGDRVAVGLNGAPAIAADEITHGPMIARALRSVMGRFAPDLVIADLPPVLHGDNALALLAHLDCALLVAAAGTSRAPEIEAAEALITEQVPCLGVVLNKADAAESDAAYGDYAPLATTPSASPSGAPFADPTDQGDP